MAKDTVQQIKERLGIQDIIAPYVKLRRAGRSLVGLCPFHKEKTPSFHVSPERGSWHCFGCGLGGDGFSFIEKIEGVDFKGALKILAEKAGVTIEYSRGANKEEQSKKEKLRALMSRACEWYAGNLKGSPAEKYAKTRDLSDETIRNWRLGFAPDAWRALLEALTAEGFTVPEMLAAGLIKEADGKQGTYYDRFRNRLMFPIRDNAGRVVAFTGRALAANDVAKYLNSPETDLYHKSEILFGMDQARNAIRTRNFTMLVEGQIDAILAHQAGFENAVALSGTALSDKHLSFMRGFSDNLMLVLDLDSAGLKATARSMEPALAAGLTLKVARLPFGKDPADIISEDPKAFAEHIKNSKHIIDFFLVVLAEQEKDPLRLLRAMEQIILPMIAVVKSPMQQDHFIQATARSLGLSSEAVRESLGRVPKHSEAADGSTRERVSPPPSRSAVETRSQLLLAAIHAYRGTPLAKRVESEYSRITEVQQVSSEISSEPALFKAEQTFGEDPREDAADELLRAFEEAVIREAHQEGVNNLRRAETAGDAVAVVRAQEVCAKLSARLAALGA